MYESEMGKQVNWTIINRLRIGISLQKCSVEAVGDIVDCGRRNHLACLHRHLRNYTNTEFADIHIMHEISQGKRNWLFIVFTGDDSS